MASDPDTLTRFVLEGAAIRGELIQLDRSWHTLLERHEYPDAIKAVLGEALAAVALLSATIKSKGSLIAQVQGEGVIKLLVVEARSGRTVRGLAHWDDAALQRASRDLDDGGLLGHGHLVLTIDPGEGTERYQGIVELDGGAIGPTLESYFEQSEQLPTRLWLNADGKHACGLLLQQLPASDRRALSEGLRQESWAESVLLAETLRVEELRDLPAQELVHRLYHEKDVRLFEPEAWRFACGCSRERVGAVLRGLGRAEVDDIVQEQGRVGVDCEFCNAAYTFDAVDVAELFASTDVPTPDATRSVH